MRAAKLSHGSRWEAPLEKTSNILALCLLLTGLDGHAAPPDNAPHGHLAHRRQGHVETPTHPEVDRSRGVRGDSGVVGGEYGVVYHV